MSHEHGQRHEEDQRETEKEVEWVDHPNLLNHVTDLADLLELYYKLIHLAFLSGQVAWGEGAYCFLVQDLMLTIAMKVTSTIATIETNATALVALRLAASIRTFQSDGYFFDGWTNYVLLQKKAFGIHRTLVKLLET